MPQILDGVELRAASGRWPAGTKGTVLEVSARGLLVEIADDQGRTVELLDLPGDAVTVIPASAPQGLAGV